MLLKLDFGQVLSFKGSFSHGIAEIFLLCTFHSFLLIHGQDGPSCKISKGSNKDSSLIILVRVISTYHLW